MTARFAVFTRSASRALRTASIVGLAALLPGPAAPAYGDGWSNAHGGPDRDGRRAGTAALAVPQVSWRHRVGGKLSATSLWATSGFPGSAYLSFAGRVEAKRWDDAPLWRTALDGFDEIITETDLDGDGVLDALIARGDIAGPMIAAIDLEGTTDWRVSSSDTATRGFGARVVDIDGDGRLELYITPFLAGQSSEMRLYRFPNGAASAQLVYATPIERDYVAGYNDIIGEFDGTPGLEILAEGARRLYLYDATSGVLESTSPDVGNLPYGRAVLRAVDVDHDDVLEAMAYSNEAWAPAQNRRHVTLFGWSEVEGAMTARWTRETTDIVNDRIAYADNSVSDLDGDGSLEVVFGVYEAASSTWTTEIRDAATGALLGSIGGHRFTAVDSDPQGAGALLFTHEPGTDLRVYRFSRGSGATLVGTVGDLAVAYCREQTITLSERERMVPCRFALDGAARAALLLTETDSNDRVVGLRSIDLRNDSLPIVGLFSAGEDFISSQVLIPQNSSMALAVALTSGRVLPLDQDLRELPASNDDVGYRGVLFGNQFASSDLVAFPLVAAGVNNERVLAITGGQRAQFLDPVAGASVGGGILPLWDVAGANRAVIADNGDDKQVIVLLDGTDGAKGIDSASGDLLWEKPGLFDPREGLVLHLDPLVVPGTRPTVWFHRRDHNRGAYDLTVLEAATGSTDISLPDIDVSNNLGWMRLSLAEIAGVSTPISGRLDETRLFDLSTGTSATRIPGSLATISIPVQLSDGTRLIRNGLYQLSLIDPRTGATEWSLDNANTARIQLGGLANVNGTSVYATGRAGTALLVIVDVATGRLDAELTLQGGSIVTSLEGAAPALGNVTAVDDLTGAGDPAFLVGSSDGFLYAIHARDHSLIWAMPLDGPVGEIATADWDGDGTLELVVSVGDGTVIGIDAYSGDAPAWVHDTNGISVEDVEELETRSTLYGAWAPVPGATSYQVAIFSNDGAVVSDFRDVGLVTSAPVEGLPLEPGSRYAISVRAVSSLGVSPDAPSDGVTVLRTYGVPSGGCCAVQSDGSSRFDMLLALICALVLLRRRNS